MTGPSLRELTGGGLVWDNHGCMPLRPGDHSFLNLLDRCHETGIDVVTLNVGFGAQEIAAPVRMLAFFRRWLAARPERFSLVRSSADAIEARQVGRLGVCFDVEGADVLGGDLDLISLLYDLGVRWMSLAYNRSNAVGGGCMDEVDEGLTGFGRQLIAEMNRVGMVVCASHTGRRTAREAIDVSSEPIIFSHSNPTAVWGVRRNIPDELMQACAARGGVVGINGFGGFLGAAGASVEALADHVAYALDLVGEDHVGIGLDYVYDAAELDAYMVQNPSVFPPSEGYTRTMTMVAPWELGRLAEVLVARGLSEAALAKLFGGNHLRIAQRVWR